MQDETIISSSKVGQRLEAIVKKEQVSCLMFENGQIPIVSKISIGRSTDNDVVIDSKLASRHHAVIQKIKDDYFLKDLESTNGTLLNGQQIPKDKYVKLGHSDTITIGKTNLTIG
jgi:pSer/pThr/pTyr-binding forkhead associated (FHA) protein